MKGCSEDTMLLLFWLQDPLTLCPSLCYPDAFVYYATYFFCLCTCYTYAYYAYPCYIFCWFTFSPCFYWYLLTLWSHLDVQITTQLAQHCLTLPPAPAPSAQSSTTSGFHNLPWIVVQKGCKTGDAHKLVITGDLDSHRLTLPCLWSTKAFPHPSDKDRLLLLVDMHLIICYTIL